VIERKIMLDDSSGSVFVESMQRWFDSVWNLLAE
jgi:hypothetical protein